MNQFTVDEQDLQWWLQLAPELKWRFASSMQDVPHSYVVRDKSLHDPDYLRAYGAIRTFGEPGKFYDRTNIYLHDVERDIRWWPMTIRHWRSKILNQASDGRMYGKQNAPSTASDGWAPYDRIAAFYDNEWNDIPAEDMTAFWKAVAVLTSSKPSILDVGAGTGGTFDAKVASATESEVIDPSQGMLNSLVMKHPTIKRVWAMTLENYLYAEIGAKFDVVTASFGSASYLEDWAIRMLPGLARRGVVLSFYAEANPPHLAETGRPDDRAALEAAKSLAHRVEHVGRYINITLKGTA